MAVIVLVMSGLLGAIAGLFSWLVLDMTFVGAAGVYFATVFSSTGTLLFSAMADADNDGYSY